MSFNLMILKKSCGTSELYSYQKRKETFFLNRLKIKKIRPTN